MRYWHPTILCEPVVTVHLFLQYFYILFAMAGTSLSLALMMFPCGLQVTNLRMKASWEDFRNAQFPIAHGEGVADSPSHQQGACAHRLAYRARYPAQGRFRILPGFCEFPVTDFLAFGWAWRD